MKKFLLVLALCTCAMAYGQDAVVENDNDEYDVFAMLVGTTKMFSSKVTITIDYGQATKFFENKNKTMRVIDKDGNAAKFNSIIDACNYMSSKGWEYVTAYPMVSNQGTCYHYLFKKKGSATFDAREDLGVQGKKVQ